MSEAQRDRVRAQFGPSAAAYVASAGHAGGEDLDRLVAWGRARQPRRVLDIATGGGHTALAFAAVAAEVVAFDLTEPMLRAARDLAAGRGAANVRFAAGDVEALPFGDGPFDAVTCRIAPHHFADVGAALREVRRVLRPGGCFLVEDILGHDDAEANGFITEVERRRDPSHVRAYRRAEWTALLRAAGLTVVDAATMSKRRVWTEWTGRMRMTGAALRDLEAFVRAAPARCRAAFDFEVDGDRIAGFTDRMILLRADRA